MSVATHEIAAVGAHLNEVYPMLPFTPVRGVGVYLENAAGRRILDLYGGHAVAALGYGHRDLSETLARQSRDLVFQTNALPLKIRDEAAEKYHAIEGGQQTLSKLAAYVTEIVRKGAEV